MAILTAIHPKLPMLDQVRTRQYYVDQLGFQQTGGEYPDYLMLRKDDVEIHFFLFKDLSPKENYGRAYFRTDNAAALYQSLLDAKVVIHPNSSLEIKPYGVVEFSLLDPDGNCLTFGEKVTGIN